MSTNSKPYQYLARKPKSVYKQLFIKGTKFTARQLYGQTVPSEDSGEFFTPEDVAADYGVPLEAVLEAIAYCESDPPEIRQDWEADEALAEATGMNDPDYKYHPSPKILPPQEMARIKRS